MTSLALLHMQQLLNTYLASKLLSKSHQANRGNHNLHDSIHSSSKETCRSAGKTNLLEDLGRVVVDAVS